METIKFYSAPAMEIVELVVESAILSASGEDSLPGFGE